MCGTICRQVLLISVLYAHLNGQLKQRHLFILEMVILFYIVLLYVLGMLGVSVYGQLLVLVIRPCCSSSLSYVHFYNLHLYFDEQNK